MGRRLGDSGTLIERLLEKIKIDEVTNCWEYQGGKNNLGYGMIRDEKRMRTTHRVSYEEHNNVKIPPGLCVCHKCDNPKCVNPAHLWLGTHKQNSKDMLAKGRAKPFGAHLGPGGMSGKKQPTTHCPHCNRLIPNNVYARYHGDKCASKI
jgi:hypothetical protein